MDKETEVKQSLIYILYINVGPSHKISKEKFKVVLVHEIGHVMFRDLNEKGLQKREEVNENANVTACVADRRSQGNAEYAVKDDFCESLGLFIEIPGLLAVISPDRYNHTT